MSNPSFARIKRWMQQHAPEVLEQLGPAASPDDIAAAEARLGFRLPPALVSLLTEHDGSDECGFWASLAFVSTSLLVPARDDLMLWVEQDREYARKSPQHFDEIHPELATDEWVAFGHQGYDAQLAIHAGSGRVFEAGKDIPALRLIAPSLDAFLERFASALERGHYALEEGFGGHYLAAEDKEFWPAS